LRPVNVFSGCCGGRAPVRSGGNGAWRAEQQGVKISSSPSTPPSQAPKPVEATPAEVLACETTQDQVTLYGEDGKVLPGSEEARKTGDSWAKTLLLPSKMPSSVSADYMKSRRWNFVAEAAGSAQSYLGTAAALGAVGIGNGPLTVGLAWMLRDGIDGVGKFVGSQFGRQGDRDPKGWFMKGEYVHAAGALMESTLAVAPGAFLALAPTANAVKAFGSTVKGAAKAPIEVHQARDNNLGEVRSKNANQDMLAGIIGGGISFGLEKAAFNIMGPVSTPVLMAAATGLKLFATHQYVKALDLNPVTEKRVFDFVRKWMEVPKSNRTPKELENLQLGAELKRFVDEPARFKQLTALYAGKNYLLDIHGNDIDVVLAQDSSPEDQLEAVMQASVIRLLQAGPGYQARLRKEGDGAARDWLLRNSLGAVPELVKNFARDENDPLRFLSEARRGQWQPGRGDVSAPGPVDKTELQKLYDRV
jgi:hypothetical protein